MDSFRNMLPTCENCGETNPRRMIGLMTVFFGQLLELAHEPGYFYLCPRCYAEMILPHLDEVKALLQTHYHLQRDSDDT